MFVPKIDKYTAGMTLASDTEVTMDVITTGEKMQLVRVSVPAGASIPLEVHDGDQFIRVELGSATLAYGRGRERKLKLTVDDAVLINQGTWHEITVDKHAPEPFRFYTLYAPKQH